VPRIDENGVPISEDIIKDMHTTMQTLGRFAIIGGTVLVALANVIFFRSNLIPILTYIPPGLVFCTFPNFIYSKTKKFYNFS
jgi:predicted RND superfamily exporter protein